MDRTQLGSIIGFLKEKGFDDEAINDMLKRCKRLEGVGRERASENWIYLNTIGIHERKIPSLVSKCPKILALGLNEKPVPMVQCLATLGTKPSDVSMAITRFPHILSHSIDEKLCPLLAFFQALAIHEKQLGKVLLLNPRLISYSIESKLTQITEFLSSLGLNREGMIGKILVRHPFIMGYSVEKRLQPTSDFLKSIGLKEQDLQRVAMNFPEVLCRDVKKIPGTNLMYLRNTGFNDKQIVVLVTGYPPILIKSSLEPRIKFLREVMGRDLDEIANYPECFEHGLKKRLELRHRMLKQRNIGCSLCEMLECNHRKFVLKFSIC
ncbi:transcription termination factor MTERF6, chloroplastic/mitochondrial-like [Aristolochia californica]|uniref:transcription termination factor MTERF6, chloroplastic/mitochondrial-like n=1 Tax=Aristolochia californica TaxID=171875 RepID=UPI0035E10C64